MRRGNCKFTQLLLIITIFTIGLFGCVFILFLFKASDAYAIILGITTTFLELIGIVTLIVSVIIKN